MRIEKVEIQAFRAYQNKEDGTFDFKVSENEAADFVSLYAPNGFGKTSFYDAVEWAITNNIHRFLTKDKFNKEVAKSEKSINAKTKQNIIRNKDVDAKVPCLVKVHIKDREPIENTLKWKTGSDYKFDKTATTRPYFKQVILSQEWIDAFLREENPSERYKIFVEYFGNKDLDNYYRDVIGLEKATQSLIKRNDGAIESLKVELAYQGDVQILKTVNDHIEKVNQLKYVLATLDGTFGEGDIPDLTSEVLSLKSLIEKDRQQTNDRLSAVNDILFGSEAIFSIDQYYIAVEQLDALKRQLDDIAQRIEALNSKKNLQTDLDTLISRKRDKQLEHLKLTDYQERFPNFLDLAKQLTESNTKTIENDRTVNESKQKISDNEIQINKLVGEIDVQSKLIIARQKDFNDITSVEKRHADAIAAIAKLSAQKEDVGGSVLLLDKELAERKKDVSARTSFEQAIANMRIDQLQDHQLAWKSDQLKEVSRLQLLVKEEEKSLEGLMQEHSSAKLLSEEIASFLQRGLELATNKGTSECPLCEHTYKSFEELAERIANNKSVSHNVQRLLASISDRKNSIDSLKKELLEIQAGLLSWIRDEIGEKQGLLDKVEAALKTKNDELDFIVKEIDRERKAVSDIEVKLNGKDFNGLREEYAGQTNGYQKTLADLEERRKQISDEISALDTKIQTLVGEGELLHMRIQEIEQNPLFLDFSGFLKGNSIDHNVDSETLNVISKRLSGELANIDAEIVSRKAVIDGYLPEERSIEDLTEQRGMLNTQKVEVERKVADFRRHTNTRFGLLAETMEKHVLRKKLDELSHTYNNDLPRINEAIRLVNLVQELVPSITPFLKSEAAKRTRSELSTKNEKYKNVILPRLRAEREKLELHLAQQINSFFYEDVINQIYSKIDPHPDYKKIKFKCDFTEEKPQLNVCVTNDREDEMLIPNLYFSTAQINVLSLSIFLAKALHGVDDAGDAIDCIFIDDPIQSMDSINILSTIDLLRSLSVNHNKQIVLSTHDENFHELLKKKIPKGLFKSKFLELESFGMVRATE